MVYPSFDDAISNCWKLRSSFFAPERPVCSRLMKPPTCYSSREAACLHISHNAINNRSLRWSSNMVIISHFLQTERSSGAKKYLMTGFRHYWITPLQRSNLLLMLQPISFKQVASPDIEGMMWSPILQTGRSYSWRGVLPDKLRMI